MALDADIDRLLAEIADVARPEAAKGEVKTAYPSLGGRDADCFGLALVAMDGTEHVTGEVDVAFPLQSISKVFSLVLAMQKADVALGVAKELWQRVGVEPSGDPFNSLVQLERERGVPRNPMINPGALIVDDVLLDHCEDARASMHALVCKLVGEDVKVEEGVYSEEGDALHRNRSMAHLMASFGNLTHPVDEVLDAYNYQCAVSVTTRQLARAVRFLANDGVDPASGEQILSGPQARRVAAIMLTCGTYDSAGQFAFEVGIPCKSGVAGAIMAVVPDQFGVCVWSPPLEASGNSVAGRRALQELTERLGLSLF